MKKFNYEGHILFTNNLGKVSSFIIYHGKDEKGNMIFTHNQIGRDTGKVWYRVAYSPRKTYATKKGEYVNICKHRLYFKDLTNNYEQIKKYISEL